MLTLHYFAPGSIGSAVFTQHERRQAGPRDVGPRSCVGVSRGSQQEISGGYDQNPGVGSGAR